MTSLLRDDVSEPIRGARSKSKTSLPVKLSALATARPTTPAPITATSIFSIAVMEVELEAVSYKMLLCLLCKNQVVILQQ
jgi:hypothetical protein